MSASAITPLPWDSELFGVAIARVTAERPDAAALAAALRACDEQGIRCAYLLLDAGDARGAEAAQSQGFVLRDVRVELDRSLASDERFGPADAGATGFPIVRATREQQPVLEALARRCITQSRFLADPRFPRDRCEALYAAFVRRGMSDPQRATLTDADAGGVIVCRHDAEQGVGVIDLVAVDERRRGEGLGARLLDAACTRFAADGLTRAEVVTQAANVAAQRLYQRAGFRTRRAGLWFHRWL